MNGQIPAIPHFRCTFAIEKLRERAADKLQNSIIVQNNNIFKTKQNETKITNNQIAPRRSIAGRGSW